jgi:hypothetical protein
VKNGVPFKTAFGNDTPLSLEERQAMCIVFGILEHGDKSFDWNAMKFKEQS